MISMTVGTTDSALFDLISALETVGNRVMPRTSRAFRAAALLVQHTWKSYALGAVIPNSPYRLKAPSGEYARSIRMSTMSPFSYYIFSDADVAATLETGSSSYDMKKTHTKGPKSRVVKEDVRKKGVIVRRRGDSYLIVPLRHRVPGGVGNTVMPETVYQEMKRNLAAGQIRKGKRIPGYTVSQNAAGQLVKRARYSWGGGLQTADPNYAGMVAMDTSKGKSGGSQYMTFRVISTNSPAHKWWQPGRPAMKITESVARNTQDKITQLLHDGLVADLGGE